MYQVVDSSDPIYSTEVPIACTRDRYGASEASRRVPIIMYICILELDILCIFDHLKTQLNKGTGTVGKKSATTFLRP